MITHRPRSKRNFHQMLKETVESFGEGGLVESDHQQVAIALSQIKKKFKYSTTTRIGGGMEDDVEMTPNSLLHLNGNESLVGTQRATTAQVNKIKNEIDRYKTEVSRMNNSIKYCSCDYAQYYC